LEQTKKKILVLCLRACLARARLHFELHPAIPGAAFEGKYFFTLGKGKEEDTREGIPFAGIFQNKIRAAHCFKGKSHVL